MEQPSASASLPSNYVSFLQLKERWLQQQSPNSTTQSDSASNIPNQPKPDSTIQDSASIIGSKSLPNRNRIVNPEHDSASNEAGRNHSPIKPEHHSASKTLVVDRKVDKTQDQNTTLQSKKKNTSRGFRNPRFLTGQSQTQTSTPEEEEKQHRYNGGGRNQNPMDNQTGGSTPEPLQEKKKSHRYNGGGRSRNPRFRTEPNQTEGSAPEPVPEEEEKQHSCNGGWNQNPRDNQTGVTTLEPVQEEKKKSHRYNGGNRNPRFLPERNEAGGGSTEPVPEKKQHRYNTGNRNARFVIEQVDSTPETEMEPFPEKKQHRDNGGHQNRNPRFVTEQVDSTPETEMEPLPEKKQHRDNGGHRNRNRNPRFVTEQNQAVGSTPESEPELKPESMPEKKQHGDNGRGRNRNPRFSTDQNKTAGSSPEKKQHRNPKQEWEPKGKTAPIAQNADNDDSGGDGVIEPVAAAVVKEVKWTNVSPSTNRRYGYGGLNRNRPARPSFPLKKGQVTAVWVKKGEGAPN